MPSRLTVAWTDTDARRDATAFCARTSWTKSKMTLNITMTTMTTNPATPPVSADTPAAIKRMMISGFSKRTRNWRQSGTVFTSDALFSP